MRVRAWSIGRRPRYAAIAAAAAAALAAFLLGVGAAGATSGSGGVRQLRSVAVPVRAVALTFDDGPSPQYTPAVLALLQRYGAKATFFVVGQEVARYPEIARQEAADGMEMGNHGFRHLTLLGLDPTAIQAEAAPVDRQLEAITGARPALYRLPQGRGDARSLRALVDMGYTVVNWSVDTHDWSGRSAAQIAAQVEREARPGAIILFHDGGGNRQPTVDALKVILPALAAQGYRFVTVSQLLEMGQAAS